MPSSHSRDLHERVVAAVQNVSVSSVVKWPQRACANGERGVQADGRTTLAPRR